ncbi:MAG: ABC transporter permease [Planctomycetota bacterium]
MSAVPTPHLTLRPPTGWSSLNAGELWRFRDLMWTLGQRDVKLRYKQTVLGAAWVVFQPLLGAGIFTFVFGFLGGMADENAAVPYFLITYAGMVAWTAFNATVTKASASLVANSALVSKVYFPRAILPASTMFSTLLDLLVSLAVLTVMLAAFGIVPGWQVLLLPVWIGLLIMLALGVGMAAASLNVMYRDIGYIMPVAMQMLLYLSPIGFTVAAVSAKLPAWAERIYLLNPLAPLLEAVRWSILGRAQANAAPQAVSVDVASAQATEAIAQAGAALDAAKVGLADATDVTPEAVHAMSQAAEAMTRTTAAVEQTAGLATPASIDVPWLAVVYASAVCVAVFLAGYAWFRRFERRFADVI